MHSVLFSGKGLLVAIVFRAVKKFSYFDKNTNVLVHEKDKTHANIINRFLKRNASTFKDLTQKKTEIKKEIILMKTSIKKSLCKSILKE